LTSHVVPCSCSGDKRYILSPELNIEDKCRVGLAQLIRCLMVELTHPGLNHVFNITVVFTVNYSFSER
jgi:hypothetical protein